MATQGQQENPIKNKIRGLLDVIKFRGIEGRQAIDQWTVTALECLLEAELARIEKREVDAS